MSEATELGMDELFTMTSSEVMNAATEEGLVKTGTYITKCREVYPKRNAEDAEYNAGRVLISLAVSFYEDDGKTKIGDTFITTSPEPRYMKNGKLDAAANRYNEAVKAVGLTSQSSAGDFAGQVRQVAFLTRVREVYVVPEEDLYETHQDRKANDRGEVWITLQPDEDDAREYYIGLGLEPRVMTDRISKIK